MEVACDDAGAVVPDRTVCSDSTRLTVAFPDVGPAIHSERVRRAGQLHLTVKHAFDGNIDGRCKLLDQPRVDTGECEVAAVDVLDRPGLYVDTAFDVCTFRAHVHVRC